MILDVFAEEGGVGEAELVAHLLDTEVGMAQVVADLLHDVFCHPLVGRLARVALADGRKVFGRDAEVCGI